MSKKTFETNEEILALELERALEMEEEVPAHVLEQAANIKWINIDEIALIEGVTVNHIINALIEVKKKGVPLSKAIDAYCTQYNYSYWDIIVEFNSSVAF